MKRIEKRLPKERVLAITDTQGLCWNCLHKFNEVHIIKIDEMGYGSGFDGMGTEIHLCDKCYNHSIIDNPIWSMEVIACEFDDSFCQYKYEDEMFTYFNQMPLAGQQFVLNEFTYGWDSGIILEAQDWLDYHQNLLSHSKCKEYNLWSIEEINTYVDRFTTCQMPYNIIYEDGSRCCKCDYGSFGEWGQLTGLNVGRCYECNFYKKRTSYIETVTMA